MRRKKKQRPKAIDVCLPNGTKVGILRANHFHRYAEKSKHLYRAIPGGAWGIDWHVLHKTLPEKCGIEIHESEDRVIYLTTAERWRKYGTVLHFKEDTVDHYVQVFLPLAYWDKVKLP